MSEQTTFEKYVGPIWLLDALGDRERTIIRLRFGLDGKPKTLEAVGNEVGLSGERIRQIQNIALSKMRRWLKRDKAAAKQFGLN